MTDNKEKILHAGCELWPHITYEAIAQKVGISKQAVHKHFSGDTLTDAVAEYAVQNKNSRVIMQLVAVGHKSVDGLTKVERLQHLDAV